MTKDVLLYAFDTMADWEYAYITTVLAMQNRGGDDRFRLRTVSADGGQVRTLGGLTLVPDGSLGDVDEAAAAMLVLPGGNTWGEGHTEALDLARRLLEAQTPVAGICGATKAMAATGLLEHHAHVVDTDDELPAYPGDRFRTHGSVARDGHVITAIGEAPLEFSREVFLALGLDSAQGIDEWYSAFKSAPDAR